MHPIDACKQALDLAKAALDAGWLSNADAGTLAEQVSALVHDATKDLVMLADLSS